MIYETNKFQLKISENVGRTFLYYRQLEMQHTEAGGVLLGRFLSQSNDVVIDKITVPMKNDIRTRFFFKKNRVDHQSIIDKVWKKSDGTCNYLGEWHTHPEEHPTPSAHDKNEWKKILKHTVCDSDKLFFIIIGTKSISVWVGFKNDLKIIKLKKINLK
ncbi:Mov34/MPN/PAD-1 family protein [Priestia megaterium]|uniref:Mov34/MPN/PAD-1 family protein n=1 Tax=Priestia megaterium TaxID=1404 RepID=UPI003CFFCBE3